MDYEQLRWQLDDAQSSLAAALARIEAYRIKERHLQQELAQLRLDGSKSNKQADASPSQPDGAAASTTQLEGAAGTTATEGAGQGAPCSSLPSYITHLQDLVPVMLISGSRKVSACNHTWCDAQFRGCGGVGHVPHPLGVVLTMPCSAPDLLA